MMAMVSCHVSAACLNEAYTTNVLFYRPNITEYSVCSWPGNLKTVTIGILTVTKFKDIHSLGLLEKIDPEALRAYQYALRCYLLVN